MAIDSGHVSFRPGTGVFAPSSFSPSSSLSSLAYLKAMVESNQKDSSPVKLTFLDDATRPGSRGYFVLEDYNSFVEAGSLDTTLVSAKAGAAVSRLSEGNPMSGAFLNVSWRGVRLAVPL